MSLDTLTGQKIRNLLQSLLLLGAMLLLVALLGWLIAGIYGILWGTALVLTVLLVTPRFSPTLLFRMQGARQLSFSDAPRLFRLVKILGRQAGLNSPPALVYLPSPNLNAASVGWRQDTALILTDGLLHNLTERELAGILAHELSHIKRNDMRVMALADLLTHLTRYFSLVGQILVVVSLPLAALTAYTVPWKVLVLLLLAPFASALLQRALSRTREFDADLAAAALTGDPAGLAAALGKIGNVETRSVAQFLMPMRRRSSPSLLRTHPPIQKRVRRLMALAREQPDRRTEIQRLAPEDRKSAILN